MLEPREQIGWRPHKLTFDQSRGAYTASGIAPGKYILNAEAQGYAPDRREVQVDPAGLQTVVILGTVGLPFFYRGEVKVPFEPRPELLAVSLERKSAQRATEQMFVIARQRKLSPVDVGQQVSRQHVYVFQFSADTPDTEKQRVQEDLLVVGGIRAVGPLVHFDKDSLSFLTNELIVKFRSHIVLEEVPAIAKRFKLEVLRRLPQAGNAFLFHVLGPVSYAMLDIAAKLVDSGLVEYAEPNLISTVVDDALNPTDFLFPMQWHLPLIHCPDAWGVIHDNIAPDLAFGSPNVVIAVVDSGVDLTNPEFTGTVSNGSTKVYQVFDFDNMVANNNTLSGGHGTCCAGVATARPNNPSTVAGQTEGVAGAAGNCRLMAIERPRPGSEVAYSDMYLWVGGFDPASSTVGFPARINPGADVITNSFGYSVGMPISGLMKDTFDFLTTYGRGGRGVLLFFSAGNNAVDFTLQRPWAAYTRTFAVAASSLGTDGITEIHCPYSNFGGAGTIDFCAPSASYLSAPYNPPQSYGILATGVDDFAPDAPSHHTAQTSTTAAASATSLTVTSSAGFAVNQFLVVGTPGAAGAEFSQVTGIPNATHLNVSALMNAHPAGTAVFGGPAHAFSAFGGTSSATPFAAGIGALLLTIRPSLTWVHVRDLLRSTAVPIDAANTDIIGIWRDANGVASNQPGYLGPVYSRWYGFGRIDALAVINETLTLGATPDVIVRENLGDSGIVPAIGTFWNSPDIWVRNASPAVEGAAGLPATYATPGPTQDAIASQDNYIYVRVRNIGPVATSTFYIRVYLTHWAGTEFVYPDNFIPSTHPGQPLPSPLVPGTYLIGEVQHTALAPNAVDIVNVVWSTAAIPPQDVIVGGSTVHWHPCLLVEISPQDGPLATGTHVWDNNNLAQKNISINYAADDGSFASVLVAGNLLNQSEFLELIIDRTLVPASVKLYVDVLDPKVKRELRRIVLEGKQQGACEPTEVLLLDGARVLIEQTGGSMASIHGSVLTLPSRSRLRLLETPTRAEPSCVGMTLGHYQGNEVFWLQDQGSVRVPVLTAPGALVPFIIGGVADQSVQPGTYLVGITQADADGRTSGAAAVELRIK